MMLGNLKFCVYTTINIIRSESSNSVFFLRFSALQLLQLSLLGLVATLQWTVMQMRLVLGGPLPG